MKILAHCVNLVLQEAARKVRPIRDALDFAQEMIQLITLSPKRQVLFEKIHGDLGKPYTSIKPLCPTRWTVKAKAMLFLIENYRCLQDTLEIISEGHDEYARRASGLQALMQQFSTFFDLSLSLAVFSLTEELSVALQAKSTSCEDATATVDVCLTSLQEMRTDEEFETFFEKTKSRGSELCDESRLPRHKQPPRRIDDGGEAHRCWCVLQTAEI